MKNRFTSPALAVCAVLLLTACATPEQRAQHAQAVLAADKAECTKLGFTPDTEAFSTCLLKLREIRADERLALEQRRATNRYYFGPHWPWLYNRGYRNRHW